MTGSPIRRSTSPIQLVEPLLQGDRLALTRLISAVERGADDARQALKRLYGSTGRAHVVGITGPPGSGKSTLTTRLAVEYRSRGKTVGIVAVDPSSPFTGGAILGDRIRMMELHADPGVFVRSMATRGSMGGLSRATHDVVSVLDAFGKEVVLVETVGVGQDEVEIVRTADTTLVVSVPGLGDDIQAIKAGVLEIADILVVNKADLDRANHLVNDLRMMLSLVPRKPAGQWQVPIHETVATVHTGVTELLDLIERHREHLESSGSWRDRRADSARRRIQAIVEDRVRARLAHVLAGDEWGAHFAAVAERQEDPYSLAERVLNEVAPSGN